MLNWSQQAASVLVGCGLVGCALIGNGWRIICIGGRSSSRLGSGLFRNCQKDDSSRRKYRCYWWKGRGPTTWRHSSCSPFWDASRRR